MDDPVQGARELRPFLLCLLTKQFYVVPARLNASRLRSLTAVAVGRPCERLTRDSAPRALKPFACPPLPTAQDGHTYERTAIMRWFEKKGDVISPKTGLKLSSKDVVPNHSLRALIQDFKSSQQAGPLPISSLARLRGRAVCRPGTCQHRPAPLSRV